MKLQTSQTQLENAKDLRLVSLQTALGFAFERTRSEPFDLSGVIEDVLDEFPNVSDENLKRAIRNGGLGMYGRTFRMSTQEVCFWIRQYLKPIKQQERL
jgi:hypothetical protein